MSRLIDADALIELIDKDIKMTENFINEIGLPSEKTLKHYAELASQLNTLKSYKGIIQDQPTAYDIEKVVAELEDHEQYEMEYGNYHASSAYGRAVEIVRKGGVE